MAARLKEYSVSHLEEYDLVILGDGTGSTLAACTFADQGQRVAVIERKYIGGSCPNIACLPSKNVVHSAKVASYFHRGEEFGIASAGIRVDMQAVRARKRAMVSRLNEDYLANFKQTGAEFICGTGRFVGPKTLEVAFGNGTARRLRGANVIVSTGTRAALGPIAGLAVMWASSYRRQCDDSAARLQLLIGMIACFIERMMT
jgi:pyruvate/2-oxoglutarate dehydrogenase complex dihydrolipoamide dehydrogenase (E3) component